MSASDDLRRGLLLDLLPFFRLCADESLVAIVLRETKDLTDDEFARGCQAALRGDTSGNPVERIRALARQKQPRAASGLTRDSAPV